MACNSYQPARIGWPPYTQSAKRADFLETLELPLGPGPGRVGTGQGGPSQSVWCWAAPGVLATGGQIGGDSFKNKSRSVFRRLYCQIGFAWDQNDSRGFFLAIGRGFGPKINEKIYIFKDFFRGPPPGGGGAGTARLGVGWPAVPVP